MGQLGWLRLLLLMIGLQFAFLVSSPLAQETAVEGWVKLNKGSAKATSEAEIVVLRAQLGRASKKWSSYKRSSRRCVGTTNVC